MRSGPGEARTILLLHIISVRPSKQPLMVHTFLKVYMELGTYFLFLQEQIKDIIIIMEAVVSTKPAGLAADAPSPPCNTRQTAGLAAGHTEHKSKDRASMSSNSTLQ